MIPLAKDYGVCNSEVSVKQKQTVFKIKWQLTIINFVAEWQRQAQKQLKRKMA